MKNILCVANFKKLHIFVMTFLLMFALCINSFALTTTDDSTDLLGRKSILLTVERENKDYFSDKKNLISFINDNTDLYGDMCLRNVEIIYGADKNTASDSAIILLELTIYGTKNIETIKTVLKECNGVKSIETDSTVQLEPGYLKGDVNGDGLITSADARLALRYAVGLEPDFNQTQIYACDFNGDGKVLSEDARSILRTAVGLDVL
ncbi:MAG: dockerin type I repeat-containing protein [Clostridia bacterium]|nr:dockerin type I repeat-containing protein [Clostridia bacterium]